MMLTFLSSTPLTGTGFSGSACENQHNLISNNEDIYKLVIEIIDLSIIIIHQKLL